MVRKTIGVMLCLGAGSRMKPLSLTTPKALLPFCGRPLLEYELEQLCRHQIEKVILVIGTCDAGFDEFAAKVQKDSPEVVLVRQSLEFGSAGVIRHVIEEFAAYEQFLVIYGDSLFCIDITSLLDVHERRQTEGCDVTLAFHKPDDLVVSGRQHSNYGVAYLDEADRVIRFVEKPLVSEVSSRYASSGVFVVNRAVIERFPNRLPLDWSRDILASVAVGRNSPVFGFDVKDGFRFDIGTIQEYVRCQFAVLDGLISLEGVPWQRLDTTFELSTFVNTGKALVGSRCEIGKHVTFRGRNILGDRVSVGDKAELSDCIILDGTTIGPAAKIVSAVVGRCCRIGSGVTLGEGSVLGDYCIVA